MTYSFPFHTCHNPDSAYGKQKKKKEKRKGGRKHSSFLEYIKMHPVCFFVCNKNIIFPNSVSHCKLLQSLIILASLS